MHILNLEIFISRRLDNLGILVRGAGPNGVDAPGLVVLVPGSAGAFPDGVFDPFLGVLVEGVGDGLAGDPGFDVVALHLFDDLDGVFCDCEEGAGDGAVLDGPGWANEHEPVGHVRAGEAEVAFGFVFPFFVEVDAVAADDGEAWAVGYVEAGGADNGVDFAFDAVCADDAGFGDLVYGGEVYVDVWLLDGFHVRVARGYAAACKNVSSGAFPSRVYATYSQPQISE